MPQKDDCKRDATFSDMARTKRHTCDEIPKMTNRPEASSLQWQSRTIGATVMPVCALIVCVHSARAWNASTGTALLISVAFALSVWLARSATPAAAAAGG